MLLREQDAAYGLVLVWAFWGIAVAQADAVSVVYAAQIAAAAIGVGILFQAVRQWRLRPGTRK
jgi:hypothetical protein